MPALTTLGSVLSANIQEKQIMFQATNSGDLHLIMYYEPSYDFAAYPLQILDVNMSQSTWRVTNAVPGRPGPTADAYHTNGLFYMAAMAAGAATNQLMSYNPASGQTTSLTNLHTHSQCMVIGDDGVITVGEYYGWIERYDPATGNFVSCGSLDTNQQYSYYLGADTRYVYDALGTAEYTLGVYDTVEATNTVYWKGEGRTSGAVVKGITNGYWFYYSRQAGRSTNNWYQLLNGAPIETNDPGSSAYYPLGEGNGCVLDSTRFAASYSNEINIYYAYPDSTSNSAFIQWRQTFGDTNWQSITATNFNLKPAVLKRMYAWDNTHFLTWNGAYAQFYLYDFVNLTPTVLGITPSYSLCDAAKSGSKVYLGAYPRSTLLYDAALAWTLGGAVTNDYATNINPHRLGFTGGKYNWYVAMGSDGFAYFGNAHEADSTGAELGWYDPVTMTCSSNRTDFQTNIIHDLKTAIGGTKLVIPCHEEKIFVFDVATKTIDRMITNLGIGPFSKVEEVQSGIVLGIGANSNYCARVDIAAGTVLNSSVLPGTPWNGGLTTDNRSCKGPDGYVWITIGSAGDLYRINPTTCASQLIKSSVGTHNVLFHNGDCYLYNPANSDLHVLYGLLLQTADATATSLRVGTLRGP